MTDVIIVGAGVVGLFCAARLARAGVRVTVLEAEPEDFSPHGPTASLAAAGMLSPIAEGIDAAHPHFTQLALASFDLWRALSKGAPWEDGVTFGGAAILAREPDALMAKVKALGRKAEPMPAGQWRKRSGFATRVENVVFVEDEGVADPQRVISGLVMDARRHGAIVQYGVDVERVTRSSVKTWNGREIEADRVVLAPGVWASDTLKRAAPALGLIEPAKGQLVPVTLEYALTLSVHASDFYIAPRLSDVVLGASFEPGVGDRAPSPVRADALLAAAERVLPGQVRSAGRGWAGVRPMSPDGAPIVGESGAALVACGHSRNGWLLAPITAEIICALVLGEEIPDLWAAFSPARFA